MNSLPNFLNNAMTSHKHFQGQNGLNNTVQPMTNSSISQNNTHNHSQSNGFMNNQSNHSQSPKKNSFMGKIVNSGNNLMAMSNSMNSMSNNTNYNNQHQLQNTSSAASMVQSHLSPGSGNKTTNSTMMNQINPLNNQTVNPGFYYNKTNSGKLPMPTPKSSFQGGFAPPYSLLTGNTTTIGQSPKNFPMMNAKIQQNSNLNSNLMNYNNLNLKNTQFNTKKEDERKDSSNYITMNSNYDSSKFLLNSSLNVNEMKQENETKNKKKKSVTAKLLLKQEKNLSLKKNNKMFSLLSTNSGVSEVSTQTELTIGDISRLEDIRQSHLSFILQNDLKQKSPKEISMINELFYPTNSFNNFNDTKNSSVNYNLLKKKFKKTQYSTNEMESGIKKKIRPKSKGGEIKIFNSVVVNNNDSVGKKIYKNIVQAEATSLNTSNGGKEIFSSKVINLYTEKKKNTDSSEELENENDGENDSQKSSDINKLINNLRGKENAKEKEKENNIKKLSSNLEIKKEKQTEKEKEKNEIIMKKTDSSWNNKTSKLSVSKSSSKNKEKDKKQNSSNRNTSKDSSNISQNNQRKILSTTSKKILSSKTSKKQKKHQNLQQARLHKKIKRDEEDSKSKSISKKNELNLREKEADGSFTKEKKDYSAFTLSQKQLKAQKKKYDPFNIFLDEYKQQHLNMEEAEIEKEAKSNWAQLDKDTKKIYNMHADREKKLQKQKKKREQAEQAEKQSDEKEDMKINNMPKDEEKA